MFLDVYKYSIFVSNLSVKDGTLSWNTDWYSKKKTKSNEKKERFSAWCFFQHSVLVFRTHFYSSEMHALFDSKWKNINKNTKSAHTHTDPISCTKINPIHLRDYFFSVLWNVIRLIVSQSLVENCSIFGFCLPRCRHWHRNSIPYSKMYFEFSILFGVFNACVCVCILPWH